MKELTILIAMTIGFSMGNFLADKGNRAAKDNYIEFLKSVNKVQKLNQTEVESPMQKQSKLLSPDLDPNLVLHN